jgi:hypothetical protein
LINLKIQEENYEVVLDGLPDKEMYGPQSMRPEDAREFEKWHAANKDKGRFSLTETIADYCRAGCFTFFGKFNKCL